MTPPPKKSKPAAKPSFGDRLDARLQQISDTYDNIRVQARNGRHARLRREILVHMQQMPGGRDLLETAHKNGIAIHVLRPGAMPGAAGKLTRYAKAPSAVSIANNGDAVQMALTLWHELRHVQQMNDWGRLAPGNTGRLRDTQRMHVLSMMIEADAYAAQTLMALHAKKQGQPQYLAALMRRESAAFKTIRALLEKTPYETYADDGAFIRAVFSAVMHKGLRGYSLSYQKNYADVFNKAATVKSFRGTVGKMKTPPPFRPSEKITHIYKSELLGATSVDALLAQHIKAQPQPLTELLEMIDKTVTAAPKLSEQDYQAARAEILARLPKPAAKEVVPTPRQKLVMRFNAAAQKLKPARWLNRRHRPKGP